MTDNVSVTAGSGTTIAADEVVDGTLGTVKVQYVKIMDGTLDGTSKASVSSSGLKVDGSAVTQPISGTVSLTDISQAEYETVAASQTDQAMGATGASGDYLSGVLIVPGTTAAGAVSIKDGAGSAISIFAGGDTTALTTLIPFFVPLGAKSTAGAWKVTTGANVTAIGVGNFT